MHLILVKNNMTKKSFEYFELFIYQYTSWSNWQSEVKIVTPILKIDFAISCNALLWHKMTNWIFSIKYDFYIQIFVIFQISWEMPQFTCW